MSQTFKSFDPEELSIPARQGILSSAIAPRPIAFASTVDADGKVNLSPFSFFNVMGSAPAVLALGLENDTHSADGLKDTTRNILATGQFVVNLISAKLAYAMNICGIAMRLAAATTCYF